MSLKIIYVDTPFWRAEVPRLSLFYGSIDYEDIRISREDFISAKRMVLLNQVIICLSDKFQF